MGLKTFPQRYAAWKWKRHCRRRLHQQARQTDLATLYLASLLASQPRTPAMDRLQAALLSPHRAGGARRFTAVTRRLWGATERILSALLGRDRWQRLKWRLSLNLAWCFLRICSLRLSRKR